MSTTDMSPVQVAYGRTMVQLAVDSWRLARTFGRVAENMDAGEGTRYLNQIRYFLRKLDEVLESSGLRVVDLEGQFYDEGQAVSAVNLGDFAPDDTLLVDQMLEPIIMGPDGLVRQGTVLLRKAQL